MFEGAYRPPYPGAGRGRISQNVPPTHENPKYYWPEKLTPSTKADDGGFSRSNRNFTAFPRQGVNSFSDRSPGPLRIKELRLDPLHDQHQPAFLIDRPTKSGYGDFYNHGPGSLQNRPSPVVRTKRSFHIESSLVNGGGGVTSLIASNNRPNIHKPTTFRTAVLKHYPSSVQTSTAASRSNVLGNTQIRTNKPRASVSHLNFTNSKGNIYTSYQKPLPTSVSQSIDKQTTCKTPTIHQSSNSLQSEFDTPKLIRPCLVKPSDLYDQSSTSSYKSRYNFFHEPQSLIRPEVPRHKFTTFANRSSTFARKPFPNSKSFINSFRGKYKYSNLDKATLLKSSSVDHCNPSNSAVISEFSILDECGGFASQKSSRPPYDSTPESSPVPSSVVTDETDTSTLSAGSSPPGSPIPCLRPRQGILVTSRTAAKRSSRLVCFSS